MKAHYLQHVPFEGLGCIEPWLELNGYDITCTQFYNEGSLPAIESIDLLIIVGGPMSANDTNFYPWLENEKVFIRKAIALEKPILGICLGSQMIASAMGAEIKKNTETEIGWFPIKRVPNDTRNTFAFPSEASVFHWHGETFDIPPNATHLATSEACKQSSISNWQERYWTPISS